MKAALPSLDDKTKLHFREFGLLDPLFFSQQFPWLLPTLTVMGLEQIELKNKIGNSSAEITCGREVAARTFGNIFLIN